MNQRIFKKTFFIIIILFYITSLSFADDTVLFQFIHRVGDAVSHVSTVHEEAYFNGRLNNTTEFINRTSTTVVDVAQDGSALLNTKYMTTQNSLIRRSGNYLSWGEEDSVNIHRKKTGQLYNSDNPFLPTVRNIPSFPNKKVRIGESWSIDGMEVHDCRELFRMQEPIQIPFTAKYRYMGTEKSSDGENRLHIIDVKYEFYQENDRLNILNGSTYAGAKGYAKQRIYWDTQKNDLDHYTEEFQIKMVDTFGNTYIFNGKSHGEVTEYKSVNDDFNAQKLQDEINTYNLDNISVNRGEKGLTISIENIQFEPDSNKLLPSEQKKLEQLGEILKSFTNDLLITGHCAERGTENARQKLSLERAEAVANFLVNNNIRDEYHIFTQGKGSTEPVASNATEEGRSKNRRVEITIMD